MADFNSGTSTIATDPTFEAKGDLLVGTADDTGTVLSVGTANYLLSVTCCTPAWTNTPTVGGLTTTGDITSSASIDWDLVDDTATALSFDATDKAGILRISSANCAEGVTMSGTLGVTGIVTANAGVVVDNFTLDGTELDLSTGDFTLDIAGDIEINADGGCINFKDASLALAAIVNTSCVGELRIHEAANYIGLKPPALSANQTWTWPATKGSACEVLTCDGCGVLSWAAAGGVTLSGTTNNTIATVTGANALIGEANLTFNGAQLVKKGAGDATIEYTSCGTTGDYGTLVVRHTTTANMACGFGTQIIFRVEDCAGVQNTLAHVGARRTSADNTGDFFIDTGCAGSQTQRLLIKACGDIDFQNNDLLNVGAASNDWTTDALTLAGGALAQTLTVESTGTAVTAGIVLKTAASGSDGGTQITFQEGAGSGQANNKLFLMGYRPGTGYFRFFSNSAGGVGSGASIWRVLDDQSSIDANTTWDDNVFDAYDDAAVLQRAFSPEHRQTEYVDGQAILRGNYCELIDMGVLRKYEDCWVGYNDQRMAALLAGGIYQTRFTVDKNHECHEARLKALEAKIG